MIPACVNLTNIFVNPNQFDLFLYDENCSYGENRYPVRVGDTIDLYNYISQSVSLDSEFEEYIITNHEKFDNNMFCCITGSFNKLNDGAVLFSSNDTTNQNYIKVGIKQKDDGEYYIFSNYNGVEIISDKILRLNKRYTIIFVNDNNNFKTWLFDGIIINGEENNADISKILNRISNINPIITQENYYTVNTPIYINCENELNAPANFGDFLYYAILFGNVNIQEQIINTTEYYATCYGEKQILFNCLENKNHLYINTKNPLLSNIMTQQSYYNYKAIHSNGKYLYLDGKSSIEYYIYPQDLECTIDNINVSFDICMPTKVQSSPILVGLINNEEDASGFYIKEIDGIQTVVFKCKQINGNGETENLEFSSNIELKPDEFINIKFEYINDEFIFYKNNTKTFSLNLQANIQNIPKLLIVGTDKDMSSVYKGFIKNINININKEDTEYNLILDLPYKSKLQDTYKKYEYLNFGARFITTPQLIDDKKGLDLYGNSLIGTRVKGDLL